MGSSSSKPAIGCPQVLEIVDEVKVELVFESNLKDKVRKALIESHPYEEPAYHFIDIST